MPYFEIAGVKFPLLKLVIEEMDALFADENKRDLIGYPIYYDVHNRVWPNAPKEIKVVWA